jgi:dTDP-4-dehydrorhamnose 3,5-epimerase
MSIVQVNNSLSARAGTLRGLHYQLPPAAEIKAVRCIRGALYDVIVDLRPESPTFLQHTAVELSRTNRRSLYVPRRFAHGSCSRRHGGVLSGQCILRPGTERGLRFDDPRLK